MRLSAFERTSITQTAREVFGAETSVYLFGSRVDDSRRGGDIDLYIVCEDISNLFAKKLRFLAKLKLKIEDQKIDVVFNEDPSRPIEQEASKWAIPL